MQNVLILDLDKTILNRLWEKFPYVVEILDKGIER